VEFLSQTDQKPDSLYAHIYPSLVAAKKQDEEGLERRVCERSVHLEAANEGLQMEIEERGRFFSSPREDLFLFSFFPSFLAAGFSALLAMLGLFPRRFLNGIGSEVQKPLAVVIIGGLIAATLLTLIVLPTLYFVIEDGLPERSGKRLNQSLKQRRRPLRLKSASVQHRN